MNTLYLIVLSMRPKQWVKNIFIFTALLFSKNIFQFDLLLICVGGFFAFCFVSGSIYLFNDLLDIEADRNHHRKSLRPIASGKLKPFTAKFFLILILNFSLFFSFLINRSFGLAVLGYVLIQFAYSLYLKNVVIMDVFCIAAGFFIRVIAGAEAIEAPVSSWLLICTIFISLFLGLSKRRHELILLGPEAQNHRKVFIHYNILLLDQMVSIATAGSLVSYSLYTLSPETVNKFQTENLWYTIPIVLYGIFRYLYLVYQKEGGGNPESALYDDHHILITLILYVFVVGIILYY
jgi:4-hydroxybenzoate polyprenyltransferase